MRLSRKLLAVAIPLGVIAIACLALNVITHNDTALMIAIPTGMFGSLLFGVAIGQDANEYTNTQRFKNQHRLDEFLGDWSV